MVHVGRLWDSKWSDGADHEAQPEMPAAVLVKFCDPHAGRIHSIHVPGCDSEAVEITPNSLLSKAYPYNELNYLKYTLLGCHYS